MTNEEQQQLNSGGPAQFEGLGKAELVRRIEKAGFSVSGPTDIRAAEDGEPLWVCDARAVLATIKGTFTVWVYDHDAAVHHDNDLEKDTFQDVSTAAQVARQRVKETNHNTGWAKVIDNSEAGRMGDTGFVVAFKKDKNGRVYESSVRDGYEGRFAVTRK